MTGWAGRGWCGGLRCRAPAARVRRAGRAAQRGRIRGRPGRVGRRRQGQNGRGDMTHVAAVITRTHVMAWTLGCGELTEELAWPLREPVGPGWAGGLGEATATSGGPEPGGTRLRWRGWHRSAALLQPLLRRRLQSYVKNELVVTFCCMQLRARRTVLGNRPYIVLMAACSIHRRRGRVHVPANRPRTGDAAPLAETAHAHKQ